MADNTRDLNTQIGRAAVILLLIYIMVIGVIRIRNQSIIDSAINLVDDSGFLTRGYTIFHPFHINETTEVKINITLYGDIIENRTQATMRLVKWNNTAYETWDAVLNAVVDDPSSNNIIIETIPDGVATLINKRTTILYHTLTAGAWTLQVNPQTAIERPYKISLVTVP